MVTDFDAHNAEQAAVWAAYHAGRPTRVPMILGINVRYTMHRPDANPDGVDFARYCADPEVMLVRQLEHTWWLRHHVASDTEMGPPSGWHAHVDFQNTYEAAWFGCPLDFHEGEVPDTLPILRDDNKRLLFDLGLPDLLNGGIFGRVWEIHDAWQAKIAAGWEHRGIPLKGAGVPGLGTDGPVTVACNLRGASEFMTDLLADPEYADELLGYIVEATIARIRAFRAKFGQPLTTPGWGFADDSIALLSTRFYVERILPHHRRLLEAFSEGGPNHIHLCGDATHLFATLQRELNIQQFDTGFPVDHGALRRELGPEAQIHGGPSVPFLCQATPDEVRAETRRILASGVCEGGRFVLREGNNLAPEVPLENVAAMYAAVREFGGY